MGAEKEATPTPKAALPSQTPAVVNYSPDHRKAGRAKRIAGFALFGLAAGTAAAGIVTGVLASHAASSIRSEAQSHEPFNPSLESTGLTEQTVSTVMYAVAGAAAIGGAVLVYFGVKEARGAAAPEKVALLPAVSPGYLGLVLHGSF
jgi:hypothetical protein